MNKNNENGFSVVGVIMFIVLLVIIATAGYFVAKHFGKKTVTTTISIKAPVTKTIPSTLPSTLSTVDISQLGIQITVPASISTLTYNYTSSSSSVYGTELEVDLSTTALASQASSCTANSSTDSANFDALGVLERVNGHGNSSPNYQIVKQYSGYYIVYIEPQDTCLPSGSSPALVNLLNSQVKALQGSLSTINPIT